MTAHHIDNIIRYFLWVIALAIAVMPALIIIELLANGADQLSLQFFIEAPRQSGREGGIYPLIISTLLILFVCLGVVVPIGLLCALYLNEQMLASPRLAVLFNYSLDILAAVPSIIYGLFGYIFFTDLLGMGFSILSGGLSLACMVLPLFIRMAQLALAYSPKKYRQAAHALNLSHLGFICRILLPSSASGIAVAIIIATGRALAETAVLIFTAGYVMRMPESLFDSGRSLSVHIYDMAMNVPNGTAAASATALVLMALLLSLNLLAKQAGRYWRSH